MYLLIVSRVEVMVIKNAQPRDIYSFDFLIPIPTVSL
jgi:hypothetical protein